MLTQGKRYTFLYVVAAIQSQGEFLTSVARMSRSCMMKCLVEPPLLSSKAWFPHDCLSRLKYLMFRQSRRSYGNTSRTTETTSITWIELSSIRTIVTILETLSDD